MPITAATHSRSTIRNAQFPSSLRGRKNTMTRLPFKTTSHVAIACYLLTATTPNMVGAATSTHDQRLCKYSLNSIFKGRLPNCKTSSATCGMNLFERRGIRALGNFQSSFLNTSAMFILACIRALPSSRQHSSPPPLIATTSYYSHSRILYAQLRTALQRGHLPKMCPLHRKSLHRSLRKP
ncbi:hypothetical protein BJY52DRAFT_1285929 [Lactarius psammicola]|nr:hypothetical protein BJY52DRAFT_1285929 [Lactarius psammicola]